MRVQLMLIVACVAQSGCSTLSEVQDGSESPQARFEDGESGIRAIRAALTSLNSGKVSDKSFREIDASIGVLVAREMAGMYSRTGMGLDMAMNRHRELERLQVENEPYRLPSVDSITHCRLPFSIQTRNWGYSLDVIVVDVAKRRKISAQTLNDFFTTKDKGWVDEVMYWLVLYAKCQPEVESAFARRALRDAKWKELTKEALFGGLAAVPIPPAPCFDWDDRDDVRWAPISNEAIKYLFYLRCADYDDGLSVMSGEEALFWAVVFTIRFKSTAGAKELKLYRDRHAENTQSDFWMRAIPLVEKLDSSR